ncbi:MAG: hypothetical protein FWH14_05020 [Oscillospiraceae bacterium]|nr:hypothetical protein [Oscillospiraceae bacterium]
MPTANSVCLLASPLGRGVTPWRDGEGMTERAVGYAPPCIPSFCGNAD